MKKFSIFILLGIANTIFAQKEIRVLDSEFFEPIEGITIFSNDEKITITNENGVAIIPEEFSDIELQANGYETKKTSLKSKFVEIILKKQLSEIISRGENKRAKDLIKEIIAAQKQNNPSHLDSYKFYAYNKFWVDTNKDSIRYVEEPKSKNDSTHNDFKKLIDKSLMFLAERVEENLYSKKYGSKKIILANKVAGLKSPIYELIAVQPIPYYLEKPSYNFFFNKFTNPVSEKGLEEYNFSIKDTIIEGDTEIVTLLYRDKTNIKTPKNNNENIEIRVGPESSLPSTKKLEGYIKIDLQKKAVKSFYGEKPSTPYTYLELEWEKRNGYYFPKSQFYYSEARKQEVLPLQDTIDENKKPIRDTITPKVKVIMRYSTIFKDFEIPSEFKKNQFKGYENEIAETVNKKDEIILSQHRSNPLNTREQNTYPSIDSIATELKIDQKLKFLQLATQGVYPIGKFNFKASDLIQANAYEGLRLQLGIGTNEKFNEKLSFDTYAAYGFKDKSWKAAIGTQYVVQPKINGILRATYTYDVAPFGKEQPEFLFQKLNLENLLSNLYYSNYYTHSTAKIAYQQDLHEKLSFFANAHYSKIHSEILYSYSFDLPYTNYHFYNTELSLEWNPFNKYLITPYGKVTLDSKPTKLKINYLKSWDINNTNFTFQRLSFDGIFGFKNFLGNSEINIQLGKLIGKAPLFYHFEGNGNAKSGEGILERFSVANNNSFETMRAGEFYSDQYFSYQLRHQFKGIKIFKENLNIDYIYRGIIGQQEGISHLLIPLEAPTKLYQEMGLELNNILLGVMGIGAYYRLGAYHQESFDSNFYFKITLNIGTFSFE